MFRYLDTETCGLYGPIVLIQYADDDGPIHLYCPWDNTIYETKKLLEEIIDSYVVGFNMSFDWFHIVQMYTTLLLMDDDTMILDECINEYAIKESIARDGPCCKPAGVLDLMLHARKGPYQSTMDRSDIRVKKVPTVLAYELRDYLDVNVELKDVYFARKKDKTKRWSIHDIEDDVGDIDPDFKDLVLKFAPSSALKALAEDALEINKVTRFDDVELSKELFPAELGYAPFATAPYKRKSDGHVLYPTPENWYDKWPRYIKYHIDHWLYYEPARDYARDDIVYTRALHKYFSALNIGLNECDSKAFANSELWFGEKRPLGSDMSNINPLQGNDTDSNLSCMVAAVRWRGFNANVVGLKELKAKAEEELAKIGFNYNSSAVCKKYLQEVMDETQQLVCAESTKRMILEDIAKWKVSAVCEECFGCDDGCKKCHGTGLVDTEEPHPAAERAQKILDARTTAKEIELYDKIILAGRFHASLNVIGTLSTRMSGADGMNPQGVKKADYVRDKFPLAWPGESLGIGDYDGFEVTLMDAAYHDDALHADLLSGKKIHGIFGEFFFGHLGYDYDAILATSGLPGEKNLYGRSKNGVFAILYGGEENTLQSRVGIPVEIGAVAFQKACRKYKQWGEERQKVFDDFCSMRQPQGIGTAVEWHEPKDFVESMFGFRRYFTLENNICRILFHLAEKPPEHWTQIKQKVIRRDREQTASGAMRSALFACAFQIQAANMRAAANHKIQSSGGSITKDLQNEIWTLQPQGIHPWIVMPLNIHDEVACPTAKGYEHVIKETVDNFNEKLKERVPLISMKWETHATSWAEK